MLFSNFYCQRETALNTSRRLKQVYDDNAADHSMVTRLVKQINHIKEETGDGDLRRAKKW